MDITLSVAVLGFNRHMRARRLSDHTIRDYNTTLGRFQQFLGEDTPLRSITTENVEEFLAYWRDTPTTPAGVADRGTRRLGAKSLENMRIALSALWTWATGRGYASAHIIQGQVKPIQYNPPPIEPYTADEIKAMLAACEKTAPAEYGRARGVARTRPSARRDKALILFLLDTGCRISEVIGLRMDALDLEGNEALVHGKGDKSRLVVYSDTTGDALFEYLAKRGVLANKTRNGRRANPGRDPGDIPVFAARGGRPLSRSAALTLIYRIADRAGVQNAHPHRFRHTFAISWLRNDGDIYTLQRTLGHASLDTVRRYLKIASVDVHRVHRRASPVENML